MLLIFFGQIGTGKSTVAHAVAKKLNFELVDFDNVVWLVCNKKKVYGNKGEFLLTLDETIRIYDSMHLIAKFLLNQKRNVILESMYFKQQREDAIKIAKEINVPYELVEVICKEAEIKKRLGERKRKNSQLPSFNLYLKYRDLLEKERKKHIIVDTSNKTIQQSSDELISRLKVKNPKVFKSF